MGEYVDHFKSYRRHLEIVQHRAFDLWRESGYSNDELYDDYIDAKADLQRWLDT